MKKKTFKNKTAKTKPKLKIGGDPEYITYTNSQNYGTKDLLLEEFHAHILHFNKMDLNVIANTNLKEGLAVSSIYSFTNINYYVNYIYDTYYKNDYAGKSKEEIEAIKNRLKKFLGKYKEKTLISGEIEDNDRVGEPIFMYGNRTAMWLGKSYFCDIDEKEYYMVNKGKSHHGSNEVYKFSVTKSPPRQLSPQQYKNNIKSVYSLHESLNSSDEEDKHKMFFDNIHITKEQKDTIDKHFFSYTTLYYLNYDESYVLEDTTDLRKKFVYRTNERFNYFDYTRIQQGYKHWAKNDLNNDEFKQSLFVGYYIQNKTYRPVYLKPDGYFSTGNTYFASLSGDVSPTYESINISEEILRNTNLYETKISIHGEIQTYRHDYLVNNTAYLFEWGMGTASAVYDNIDNHIYNFYTMSICSTIDVLMNLFYDARFSFLSIVLHSIIMMYFFHVSPLIALGSATISSLSFYINMFISIQETIMKKFIKDTDDANKEGGSFNITVRRYRKKIKNKKKNRRKLRKTSKKK